jgi:hypothetical protein
MAGVIYHIDHHDVGVPGGPDDLLVGRELELVVFELDVAPGEFLALPIQVGLDVIGDYDFRFHN